MTPIDAQALAVTIESRILALWKQEKWDRRWMRATWTQARHDRMTELRALLALRRTAQRLARRTVERQDPITAARAATDRDFHAWQSEGPWQ